MKVLKSREGFAESAQDEVAFLRCVSVFCGSVLCSSQWPLSSGLSISLIIPSTCRSKFKELSGE